MSTFGIRNVLFDLDGTLVDSAPDLAAAANRLRIRRGQDALPFEALRGHAGRGARGLIGQALGIGTDHPTYPALAKEFLDDYEAHCFDHSYLFDGVAEMLTALSENGIAWGIVTNKHARFTIPICHHLGLDRAAVIVCGDATGVLKPAPDNLLLALQQSGFKASETLYVGDDLRDAQAARAAQMKFAAAAYGYLGLNSNLDEWQADFVAPTPKDLLAIFGLA